MSNIGNDIEWKSVERGRAFALACRLDRQLHEAAEIASRPEVRLAGNLRRQLAQTVAARAETAALFDVVAGVHRQLAYLPKPELPTGLRVFLRELCGQRWDSEVVVASVSEVRWPTAGDGSARNAGAAPVTVIPRAELHNPLMWPLIGLQAAAYDEWRDAKQTVAQRTGPALLFARAEAALPEDSAGARALWEQASMAMTSSAYEAAGGLALALADDVLISAHRRGATSEGKGIYGRLGVVHDEPAGAVDILHAGWLHWHGHALNQLLALEGGAASEAERWMHMCRFVNGIDDLLCRSLDVAAVHRFYATEGAMV